MKKTAPVFVASLLSAFFAANAFANGPVGFSSSGETAPGTVAQVKADARDDAIVTLRGQFVERLGKDKYLFRDEAGDTITAELSDDRNWSHVVKDKLMTIVAEVDRDFSKVEIDVLDAK